MSKPQKQKKMEALVHNTVMETAENIFCVGSCTCGGNLFLYLRSQDENIQNIYCDKCDNILNAFLPKQGPLFFISPLQQVEVLAKIYGSEKIEKLALQFQTEESVS
jgi:coenzyme F420-reducing hydrogenase gamma subunit